MAKKKSFDQVRGGLSSLLKNIESEVTENQVEVVKTLSHNIAEIPIKEIKPNEDQPRKDFDAEALQELTDSIKVHGLIQPITVRRIAENHYEIISGERRWRASQSAGLNTIPAYIRVAKDEEVLEMALIENIQRENLNPLEIATTYQRLKEEFDLTDKVLSERVGKKRATITNYLGILELPPLIKKGIKEYLFSQGHAKAIRGFDNPDVQEHLYKRTVREELSVRELESLAKAIKSVGDNFLRRSLAADEELTTSDLMLLIQALNKVDSSLLKNFLYDRIFKTEDDFTVQDLDDITRFLDTIEDKALKQQLYNEISENRATVFELATFVDQYHAKAAKKAAKKEAKKAIQNISPEHQAVQDRLNQYFDRKVKFKANEVGKGQITIDFKDQEELNDILEKMRVI